MNEVTAAAFTDELAKIAEGEEKKLPHPAAIVGSGLAGAGLGFGAGHLGMEGINRLLKKRKSGKGIPTGALKAAPYVAGLTGLGLGAHQAYTWDKVRKSREQQEDSDGRQDS